ncbi:MAG TPA: hypothetical protein VN633_17010 [Bryobacteraceae bacterium]|nr:hypothetical protein [Bryobacteraceae bacterium]
MWIRAFWISVVLCFLSLYARADSVVTLDFSDFKVDSVPPEQFQPIGFGDYFMGATVPDAFGNPITGPNYGIYSAHSTDPFAGPDIFPGNAISGYGSPTISLNSTTGFIGLSFNWINNPSYVPPGQNSPVQIFFLDASGNPVTSSMGYALTGPASGFESISSGATAYSAYFGYPGAAQGRTWQFTDISFDLVSLPDPMVGAPGDPSDPPASAPEPTGYALMGFGVLGFGALLKKYRPINTKSAPSD